MDLSILTMYFTRYGAVAIFVIVFLEYLNMPGFPAGIIMPLAGVMASKGNIGFGWVMVITVAAGLLGSRYEFVRYCYYMGRLEYNMNNLQVAKHWFAQTVSFGLHEYMSRRAADFLARLDAMQVPYAAVPPAYNQYYCNRRNFNMVSGIISILVGLVLVIFGIIYI